MRPPKSEPGLPFSPRASSIVRLCVLRIMRCADIIMLLRFLNLARALERLPTPSSAFPLPEIASGGVEVAGRGCR